MADKQIPNEENFVDDDIIVEMTDEEGNTYYYVEEMVIPVGKDRFALLIEVHEHEHDEGCDCGCEDDDVIIAKIVTNDAGEDEYIEPTDEEFAAVQAAYDKLLDEDE